MSKRVAPAEAQELMAQGYAYVDVRSVPEFEASHPAGAVNIPIMHRGPAGLTPNPKFLAAFTKTFPEGSKVILGCAGGKRSARAAEILEREGYDGLVDLRTGFGGATDADGRVTEAGWQAAGLPCEAGAPEGRCWKSMEEGC